MKKQLSADTFERTCLLGLAIVVFATAAYVFLASIVRGLPFASPDGDGDQQTALARHLATSPLLIDAKRNNPELVVRCLLYRRQHGINEPPSRAEKVRVQSNSDT